MQASLTFLNIPGYTGSGPEHWQTLWEQDYPNFHRVHQHNWNQPDCLKWVENLNDNVIQINAPMILVAHSIGCLVVIQWALKMNNPNVKGAFLVAPADPKNKNFPLQAKDFHSLRFTSLPFPSLIITSTNDPYLSTERALIFAKQLGSKIHQLGPNGHINTASKLGKWKKGKILLNNFTSTIIEKA